MERNRDLVAFDIVRTGDDITLAFALKVAADKADFRLLGNKHDYYRMAMGVRLEETFSVLVQADPNIKPLEILKNDQEVILRLAYSWPEGTGPAAPPAVAPPAPDADSTAGTPAGKAAGTASQAASRRERSRFKPPPEEDPERNPNYFVPAKPLEGTVPDRETAREPTPAPAPPPKAASRKPAELASVASPTPPTPPTAPTPPTPPSAPSAPLAPLGTDGEVAVPPLGDRPSAAMTTGVKVESAGEPAPPEPSPAEKAFGEASEDGSLDAWTRFVDQFPNSPQAPEARKRVEALRAEGEFEKTKGKDTPEAYRDYLKRFPSSLRAGEAEARLRALELRRERAEAEGQARDEADRRRREAYEETRRLDNVMAYRVFLAAYPDTPEAPEIHKYLEAAEADDAAFAEAANSAQGLEAYVATRPKGRHAEDARKRLNALRNAAAEGAFRDAEARGTPEAYEGFLKSWPRSPKAAEARAALEALRRVKAEAGAAAAQLQDTTLVAPFVSSAPVLNGRSNDGVWQGSPLAEVPLTGSRTLRLRAAHDGRNLYLLAQWGDGSNDAHYRPWQWDAEKKTYRQSGQLDDALAVALYRGKPPTEACMLQGQNQDADLWVWRAFWSELSGLADDQTFRVSRERIPKSNSFAGPGGGQLWIREDADAGTPGWSFFIPVDYQGNAVPSYKRAEANGSRGDVRAAGLWDGGAWTVEFARALDTRRGDDLALKVGNAYAISFAVYDKSEKGRHATSGMVRLELRGR